MLEGLLLKQGNVLSLESYKRKKTRQENTKDAITATIYDKGIYTIKEIKEGGQVVLDRAGKEYKMLLEYPTYKQLEAGMRLKALLKRKVFYVYWEIEYIQEIIK